MYFFVTNALEIHLVFFFLHAMTSMMLYAFMMLHATINAALLFPSSHHTSQTHCIFRLFSLHAWPVNVTCMTVVVDAHIIYWLMLHG